MEKSQFNHQVQQEQIKDNIINFMKMNLQNIYRVCSKKCVDSYASPDLNTKEKICLSKCFDRKSESFQLSMEYINQYSQNLEQHKTQSSTSFSDLKFE